MLYYRGILNKPLRTYRRAKPKSIESPNTKAVAPTATIVEVQSEEPLQIHWPQPDPCIDSVKLNVEASTDNGLSVISGYRIVELRHVIEWSFKMERHRRKCESSQIEFLHETHNGFHNNLTFKCSMCEKTWTHCTESTDKINTSFVWGTVTAGSYYTQAAHVTSLMDIPTMSAAKFRRIENKLGTVWGEHLTEEIKKAGEEERAIALEKGQISSDGVPFTTVYVDGGWLKRSYGHNFDSSSGMNFLCDDYVEIYDGRDPTSPTLGKYCKSSQIKVIETTGNHAFVKFKSDFLLTGKGFLLNYNAICNNNLTGTYGVIESFNYPGSYPENMNCTWTINVPKGNKINATFTHFDVRPSPRYSYSYMRHRNSWNSDGFMDSPIRRFGLGTHSPFDTGYIVRKRENVTCNIDYLLIGEPDDINHSKIGR